MADNLPDVSQLQAAIHHELRQKGLLRHERISQAFQAIPRHWFLPDVPLETVYTDQAIPLKYDAFGMVVSLCVQPTLVASLLDQMQVQEGQNILQIGTSNGYVSALLKHLVGESGYVTTLELDKELAESARRNLDDHGFHSVQVVNVDAIQGYAPRAMYDQIISLIGVWDVPNNWLNQLKPNGKLVTPIWLDGVQVIGVFTRQADGTYLSVDNRPSDLLYIRGENMMPMVQKQIGSTAMYILADDIQHVDTAALHTLLSDDHEFSRLYTQLSPLDFWHGFQLYLMLNEPTGYIFAVYVVVGDNQAYGLDKNGIVLFAPASAAFGSYFDGGLVHVFAGSDAFLEMQRSLDAWIAAGRPDISRLRVQLIHKTHDITWIGLGRVYERDQHYVHAWLE